MNFHVYSVTFVMSGFVYCFTNPSMPGLVKIGFTEATVEQRLEDANAPSTWIPTPFTAEFAKYVKNANHKEQVLHQILHEQRVNPRREFFRADPDRVKLHFELMDGAWWNPQETEEADEATSRVLGDDVIRQFLNTHVFPADRVALPVQWTEIASAFQIWKKRQGYKYGATMKLREALTEAYGQAVRGAWANFRIETEAQEYCDDDRHYIRPSK